MHHLIPRKKCSVPAANRYPTFRWNPQKLGQRHASMRRSNIWFPDFDIDKFLRESTGKSQVSEVGTFNLIYIYIYYTCYTYTYCIYIFAYIHVDTHIYIYIFGPSVLVYDDDLRRYRSMKIGYLQLGSGIFSDLGMVLTYKQQSDQQDGFKKTLFFILGLQPVIWITTLTRSWSWWG